MMKELESQKNKEGDAEFKEGINCLKTSIIKWSKDYVTAAFHFDAAAKCYKHAKNYEKSLIALEKNIEVNEQLKDNWAAARCIEGMVLIYMENIPNPDITKIVELAKKASIFFKFADSPSNGVQLSVKVVKFLKSLEKNEYLEAALALLEEALIDIDDHNIIEHKGDVFNLYIFILVEMGKLEETIDVFKKEIQKNKESGSLTIHSYCLAAICLMLVRNETIGIEDFISQCISQVNGFIKSKELEMAERLVDFYNEGNQEEFDKICIRPTVTSIFPTNIVKLVKKVKVKFNSNKNNDEFKGEEQKNDENNEFKKNLL